MTIMILGFASYHIKPLILGGIVLGGLIFGTGMAILGYCPGTLAISFGEGSADAFIGIIGGLSGLILSLIRKDFKITLIHDNWKKYKGTSSYKRIIWSFVGGFILIIGARMAGGCTSGHIISGGMQLAVSSLVFAIFVFAGLLITGKTFYKAKKNY